MMSETILVTGGAGFIGSHLCEKLLEMGNKVISLDNFHNYYDPKLKELNIQKAITHPHYTLVRGDILDTELLKKLFDDYKIDKVVHLAAMAGVRNSILAPLDYVDIDIKGTVNLLSISNSYKIKRFVFASSSSVYGNNTKTPFSESDNTDNQVSPYAAAKKCGELYCRTYSNLYKMSIGCMRFFTVYGPRQRPDMAIHKFVSLIDKNETIKIYGDGTSLRDYTYIDDIINGLICSLDASYDFEIFNLGNSKIIRLIDLVRKIETLMNKKAKLEFVANQPGDVPITFADITKSYKCLNYHPNICIEKGISNFINWYMENKQAKAKQL